MMRSLRPARLPLAVIALAVVGMLISAYLTWVHYAERPIYCAGNSSCETVNNSAYAGVGGVPVALLGLAGYAVMALFGAALLRPWPPAWAAPGLVLIAVSGALYSAYLTWVELAILHAVCIWCAASAVVVTALAALAVLELLRAPSTPAATTGAIRPDGGSGGSIGDQVVVRR